MKEGNLASEIWKTVKELNNLLTQAAKNRLRVDIEIFTTQSLGEEKQDLLTAKIYQAWRPHE